MIMNSVLANSLITLLDEAYISLESSFFIDGGKGGVLGFFEVLSASQASKVFEGKSIAAHLEHLRWSLHNLNSTINGDAWNPNWSESWLISGVSKSAWLELGAQLNNEYRSLRLTLLNDTSWASDQMKCTGLIAAIAHAGYHLGAMRALEKRLKLKSR
jgi:hypothetical protein